MRPALRRRILMIVVALVVTSAIVYGFLPKPMAVDAVTVRRGPLRVTVEEEGKTRVVDRFVVSAPVAGYMRRIHLDVGDPVRKGATVVELEPVRSSVLDPRARAEAAAALASAQANLNAAIEKEHATAADDEYARQQEERAKALFAKGYISRDELERLGAEAKRSSANRMAASAAVRAARADLEKAQATLGHTPVEGIADRGRVVSVSSPVSGRVLKKTRESEGVVNAGDPLIDVGDPARLEVRTEVLSADAVRMGPGTPVLFERWGGGVPLAGKVRIVEPTAFTKVSSLGVEEQRVFVVADIISVPESWQRLGDGYRVEASFIVWEGRDVLQLPASALFRRGDEWAVFVIESGRARLRTVKIGHRSGLAAEVLSGLREGDSVISHPSEQIRDSVRVEPRPEPR